MRGQLLLWVFLPSLFGPQTQIWLIIYSILLFTIPATLLTISFNAMYAAAVPIEYRHHMAAIRNALLAVVYVITSLISGWLLNILPMTSGYTLIFLAGFLGSAMSAYHLFHLRHVTTASITEPQKIRTNLDDLARAGETRTTGLTVRTSVGMRVFSRGLNLLRVEVLQGRYGKIVAALFVFHFAQFLPIPVFPLFWVDNANFTDWEIGVGTALFYLAVLLGSLIFVRVAKYWDNRRWTASSAILMGLYPLLTAFSYNMPMLALASILGGLAWSIAATTLGNYLLEEAPEAERPAALAWYNLVLNAAVLIGSLGGSAMAVWIGVVPTLLLATGLRAVAGLALWKWH
jgi:hypothetical protein